MNPETGKRVKLLFRNGTLIEGIVEEWLSNYVRLRSESDESIMIITHPEEDIMLIKILPEQRVEKKEPPVSDAAVAFQKLLETPGDPHDPIRNKSLAELRDLMTEQERQIMAKKLKSHYPTQVRRPEYGYPGLYKKPGSK